MKFFNKTLVLSIAAALIGAASAEVKIATVDVQKVFKDYYKTHEAQKSLDEMREKVKSENDKRIEKIQEIEKSLTEIKKQMEDSALSDASKNKLLEDFQLKNNEGVALDQSRRDFLDRQNRILGEHMKKKMGDIVADITKVTEDKAREDNYDLVFDKSGLTVAQTKVLLFAKDSFDMTDAIIKKMNADAPAGFDPSKVPAPTVPVATPGEETPANPVK